MTYVCITGNEQNPASLQQRLERVLYAHPRVLCELRLDFLDLNPAAAFGFLARLPPDWAPRLVLTQRLKASGAIAQGTCSWDVLTWQSWWKDVMALRPWFAVDLDWLVLDQLAGESLAWRGKFRSRHAFFSLHATLDEAERFLPELIASAKEHNAGVKLAVPVGGVRDLVRLTALKDQLNDLPMQIVVAMGSAGKAWRWSSLAGELSYFAAEKRLSTAPGQDTLIDVLPYLNTRERPDLFLLFSDNPDNRHGEEQWNRAFLRRGAECRYINIPCLESAGADWARQAYKWMDRANIQGASITKPFKLSFPSPTNTLKKEDHWIRENTDAGAVAEILSRKGISPGASIVVAGGGGAALAVEDGLKKRGYNVRLWVREVGRLGVCPDGDIFVSTWPGEFQEALVQALPERKFHLVLDAQFSRTMAPLEEWSRARGIDFVSGLVWWKHQARLQDRFWFGPERLGKSKEKVMQLVPSSKSETIRALAIALAFGVSTEIEAPSICEDAEVFIRAMENLGSSVDRDGILWRVFPEKKMVPPSAPIDMGEGATGLRILGALSSLMQGRDLLLSAHESLRARPQEELLSVFSVENLWPLKIPTGKDIPSRVRSDRSSQFATGFLIAGAAKVFRGDLPEFRLEVEGDLSQSYLDLTVSMLEETGLRIERGKEIIVRRGELKNKFRFYIEKDASSLAFLEVFAKRWGLSSFFSGSSRQGDAQFPLILKRFLEGEKISLRQCPDLAPPLWAAAILFRRKLEIIDVPQLRLKESDRTKLLVEAAQRLGAKAEIREDGFLMDASKLNLSKEVYLKTEGDHRLAMAFGLLSSEESVLPDRKDCVAKSFPDFWQALSILEESLPG